MQVWFRAVSCMWWGLFSLSEIPLNAIQLLRFYEVFSLCMPWRFWAAHINAMQSRFLVDYAVLGSWCFSTISSSGDNPRGTICMFTVPRPLIPDRRQQHHARPLLRTYAGTLWSATRHLPTTTPTAMRRTPAKHAYHA